MEIQQTQFDPSMFEIDKEKGMVNLTKIAKSLNKRLDVWLKSQTTKDFLEAYQELTPNGGSSIEIENGNGTWVCREIALEFAQWISPKFKVFCIKRLDELFQTGKTELKPLSKIDLIIQSAIALKEQNERLEKMENAVKEIESKLLTTNTDYYTIMGYCNLRGLRVDVKVCNVLGRKCSKRSKELGYLVSKTYSTIFGKVNTYHIDILYDVLLENKYIKEDR